MDTKKVYFDIIAIFLECIKGSNKDDKELFTLLKSKGYNI